MIFTSSSNRRKIFLQNDPDTIALFNTSGIRSENAAVISWDPFKQILPWASPLPPYPSSILSWRTRSTTQERPTDLEVLYKSRIIHAGPNQWHREKSDHSPLFPAAAEENEEEEEEVLEFHVKTSFTSCVRFGNTDGPFTVNPWDRFAGARRSHRNLRAEGNKTCYSLKPKSLVEHTSVRWYLYIFLFPLSLSLSLFLSILLRLSAVSSLDTAGRIVALGYQTGHKLIPSNVLIRYPILGSPLARSLGHR